MKNQRVGCFTGFVAIAAMDDDEDPQRQIILCISKTGDQWQADAVRPKKSTPSTTRVYESATWPSCCCHSMLQRLSRSATATKSVPSTEL
jgi:hypothetical protein